MINKTQRFYWILLLVVLFLGTSFVFDKSFVYAGCIGCSGFINNCPASSVTDSYTIEATFGGGTCQDICPRGSNCTFEGEGCTLGTPYYRINGGSWQQVPATDISRIQVNKNCTCDSLVCDIRQERIRVGKKFSSPGTYTIEFKSASLCGSACTTSSCTFIIVPVVPACTNDCSLLAKKDCCNADQWKRCGYYDADPCLEWGPCSSCSATYPNTHCEHCSVDNRPNDALPCCCNTGYILCGTVCTANCSGANACDTNPCNGCSSCGVPGCPACNNSPNTPTLIAPPHNTWINYNPTFQAQVSDPDVDDDVRAYFNISGYGNGWGNWVANGGTSQWGPVGIPDTNGYWWRAYTQDSPGLTSPWSGYWLVKKDTVAPTRSISYPTGTIDYTSFTVTLTESDDRSGINTGAVDVSIDGGGYVRYANTISNFNYTGLDGHSYRFRYTVKDNAGNWSGWVYGGIVTVKLNKAPNTPTLIAPPHNTWINYNPTFQAQVSDPDVDDDVRAYFTWFGWGNWVGSGGISQYGPVNLGTCFTGWWRAYAQDDEGETSNWSGWWLNKIDKDDPEADISYPSGTIDYTTFSVSLSESDPIPWFPWLQCSGIAQGDVDYRKKLPGEEGWGMAWEDYTITTSDFDFTGLDGYSYWFRYRVKDNANNWSKWIEGSPMTINLNEPPSVSCNDNEVFVYCTDSKHPILYWSYSDPESNPQAAYQIQADNNSNFSSPEDNTGWHEISSTAYTCSGNFSWNTKYYWRVRVRDSEGGESSWSSPSCDFSTPLHAYPEPDFNWQPERPAPEEETQFFDQTTYHNSTGSVWVWTFQDGDPSTSAEENPLIIFQSPGAKTVTLTVADSDGYSCPADPQTLNASLPLPKWKEIKPW